MFFFFVFNFWFYLRAFWVFVETCFLGFLSISKHAACWRFLVVQGKSLISQGIFIFTRGFKWMLFIYLEVFKYLRASKKHSFVTPGMGSSQSLHHTFRKSKLGYLWLDNKCYHGAFIPAFYNQSLQDFENTTSS